MRSTAALLLSLAAVPLFAGTIEVTVKESRGRGVRDAVVYAVPKGRELPLQKKTAVMDQKDRMFIPHVLPVQTGTSVEFPNSDDIRHHVYSFSPAKQFQLPLYKGDSASPIVFDKPGVVTLGCNIHDRMSAFIVVVETPYFGKSEASGSVTLQGLESGDYALHVWYPDLRKSQPPRDLTIGASERLSLTFSTGNGSWADNSVRGRP